MRLYNIYYVCRLCLPSIEKIKYTENSHGANATTYYIIGWEEFRGTLETLKSIKCVSDKANNVYGALNSFDRDLVTPDVSADTRNKFNGALKELKLYLNAIIELYESLNKGESQSGIDVKIPSCSSLKEYVFYLKEIDFIFTQCPYLLCEDEEIKFSSVDVGSQWLEFFVVAEGSFHILNNLAKLIDKAVAIKSNFTVYKQQAEMLETMKQKNEVGEEVLSTFKMMKQITINGYVKELEEEIGELKDGEERGKVEKALEKMSDLIDKGVEIYSSIETPKEIKVLFPMQEEVINLPDGIIKLIEQKKDTEASE